MQNNNEDIARAGKILRDGGLVAIPTETVYGLAANALDGAAVAKIFIAKGRPQDNPLIVHISHIGQWDALVSGIPPAAKALAEAYWPGPLTIILPKSDIIPDEVSAGLDTVAVRFPSMRTTRKIIDAAGVPLAAPSANLSGSPSPTCARHTLDDMKGRIDAVLDGGECNFGVESTVVTLATPVPRLLRPGAVTPEELREVLGEGVSVRISNMIENVYRNSTGGDIRMSDEFSEAFYALHDYLYRTVYKGSAAKAEEGKAEDMIEILFHYLCNHPDVIPDEYRPVMREEGIKRAAADYIACMSDTYAVQLYKDLFIPRGWDGNAILH